MPPPKKKKIGSRILWCDADANASDEISKATCPPPPSGGGT